jgi:predicted ATPase
VQLVLVVFEDLHWIDTETQALLDSLVESLPTARLLLLVNYRPEYQHSWGGKTYYAQHRLDPLAAASADVFLQALLGNDPGLKALKPLLVARTAGNPFFLEESVRTLVETGVLMGTPGAYRLAQALPAMQVPATVQAVLAARIDRLPPEEKHLLQTAAVIGTEVPLPLLQIIAELPEATLYRGLAHLQAAEFLYETRLFPEQVYTFKHALTHEVAYGGLLSERRRVLHAHIVEALERLAPDRLAEQVERLAHHALRGAVWGKALAYCRQAGEKALARSAHREAVGYLEQALSALPHLLEQHDTREQAIDLRLALRSALLSSGDLGRILTYLREVEALAEALDDPHRARRRRRTAAHAGGRTAYVNRKSGLSGELSFFPGGSADAGWPSGGGAHPCRAGAGACPYAPGTGPPGVCPAPPRRHCGAAQAPGERAGCSPLPPGSRSGRGAGHAPPPGPLPLRPWHTVRQN